MSACLHAQDVQQRAAWNRPVKPFRIAGNLYYVGVEGISAFLVTTPKGSILLDGGLAETAPLIEQSIAALGQRVEDVRFLLNSHAHHDHCGGLPALQRRSGAQMVASEADSVMRRGRRVLDCTDRTQRLPDLEVARVVHDGDVVELGGTRLTAHITAGHTRGCTTWTLPVVEAGKTYQVLISCSTTVAANRLTGTPTYPGIVDAYERTFARMRTMKADIFLGAHPMFFDMEKKLALVRQGRKDAFIDPAELGRVVAASEKDFREELARQRGGTESGTPDRPATATSR